MLAKYCLLLFAIVLQYSLNPVVLLVHAQDDNPPGFVSIDCGLPEGSDYRESTTGIYYKSDSHLIDSGEIKNLSPGLKGYSDEKYFSNVRSFPQGKKNCYTIQPSPGKGNKYLIRASFLYGNYDNLNDLPTFDLNLGADTWSNIIITGNEMPVREEIIHVLSSDYIHVCLIKTGKTTPFISALELRPLSRTDFPYSTDSGSLQTIVRGNCDPDPTNALLIRYKDDIYDRIWSPRNLSNTRISTPSNINNTSPFQVPKPVLRTACEPDRISDPFRSIWYSTKASDEFQAYFHFAELEKLEANNQSRAFYIYINDKLGISEPIVPQYQRVNTIFSTSPHTGSSSYTITLSKTANSTLPPILNAFEVYKARKFSNKGTNETDVSAILNIKSTYKVIRDWQGDPCEPEDFLWDGLKCNYSSSDHSTRITSLDLSTSQLKGEIARSIADLTELRTLDLSNNELNGQVPEFLSRLPLTVLNLKGNKFTGPIPAQLLENQKKEILSLSYDVPGDEKKNKTSSPAVIGTALGSVLFLAAIFFGVWIWRRRRVLPDAVVGQSGGQSLQSGSQYGSQSLPIKSEIERKNRQFTYSEVVNITRNFQEVLGEGAFGKVYHGYVGDIQVAVKMLSASSTQGLREFETEASLLMSVSHKNVTSLLGYCHESTNIGIIYEYMANRSLCDHLSGSSDILSWKIRLQIALDVAEGLEYLHHGCRPSIIHRDVKTSNILLNEKFQANLGDFGLSKAYPAEGGTHLVTGIAGTPGYIDPEYSGSGRLTEKSDVFSFGVVLLEIITGRPALLTNRTPIAKWVDSTVRNGDVRQVIDPRLRGKYDVNSAWKAVELGLACASRTSSSRPAMNIVVLELKECLDIEVGGQDANSNNAIEMALMVTTMDAESSFVPEPR